MKTLFIITTKDIPLSRFSKVNQKLAKELDSFLEKNILCDYEAPSIKHYLQNYTHKSLSKEVKDYLYNCDSIPILKRVIGDYGVYVSLCLSEDEAGMADSTSHDYIGTLVRLSQNDFGTIPEQVFIIAHEADLTYSKEIPRFFGQEECLSEILGSIPDGHIYIYWHESRYFIYNDFIKKLTLDDECFKKACKDAIRFFGVTE